MSSWPPPDTSGSAMVVGDASAEGREVLHLNDGDGGHIFSHRVWPFHEYHCPSE